MLPVLKTGVSTKSPELLLRQVSPTYLASESAGSEKRKYHQSQRECQQQDWSNTRNDRRIICRYRINALDCLFYSMINCLNFLLVRLNTVERTGQSDCQGFSRTLIKTIGIPGRPFSNLEVSAKVCVSCDSGFFFARNCRSFFWHPQYPCTEKNSVKTAMKWSQNVTKGL